MDDLGKAFRTYNNKRYIELKLDFEAQLVAALMVETNTLVSIKTAAKLCSISRQEIDRRINKGTFPAPTALSGEDNAMRKAFRLRDIQNWIEAPAEYSAPE